MEEAQATLLHINYGKYPLVTSSNPSVGRLCVGTGKPPGRPESIIGGTKDYTTKLGNAPFTTEKGRVQNGRKNR